MGEDGRCAPDGTSWCESLQMCIVAHTTSCPPLSDTPGASISAGLLNMVSVDAVFAATVVLVTVTLFNELTKRMVGLTATVLSMYTHLKP